MIKRTSIFIAVSAAPVFLIYLYAVIKAYFTDKASISYNVMPLFLFMAASSLLGGVVLFLILKRGMRKCGFGVCYEYLAGGLLLTVMLLIDYFFQPSFLHFAYINTMSFVLLIIVLYLCVFLYTLRDVPKTEQ